MEFEIIIAEAKNSYDQENKKSVTDVTFVQRLTEEQYKELILNAKDWRVKVNTTEKKKV